MRIEFFKAIVGVVFVIAVGVVTSANAQSVTGSIGNGAVSRGVVARGTVVLSVPSGLHVNSNRPGSEYAIPTSVSVSATGVKIGAVSYPRGRNRKFAFSENTINVYEGRTSFGFNVTVPPSFKGKTLTVRVSVKYQACTDEVCYPPKTITKTLTARVN